MLPGLKPAGMAALALMLGLGIGAWSMRLYFDRTLRHWDPEQRFVAQLAAELGLDDVQQQRVSIVLAEEKARMEVRRRGWALDVSLLGREGEGAIARLLTPAQAQRYSALSDQVHGRMERFLWASQDSSTAVAAEGPNR
jgi:hypothetical protein